MSENESQLEEFKKSYKEFQSKYGLPDFDELNRDFQIEKASENETDFVLKEIRKIVAEKIFNYLRTIEALLNPQNAPMFVLSIVKTLNSEDRNTLSELYKELAKNELKLLRLDLNYSEEAEAQFIKDACKVWERIKNEVGDIVNKVEKNWDSKVEPPSSRNYFG